jgi:alanyl aminopeptidase
VRILTLRGREAEGRYAASVTASLIELLERYTGIPYPYDKLDEVGVPNQSHAMENAGLITYGQRSILLGPGDDTVASRRRFARVCAHELAHHWTGDLVTLSYWDDTWLNESFASFLGSKVSEQFQPEWGERMDRVLRRQEAMDADSLLSARRIHQPIVSKDDIVNAFDSITYAKGESVLRMMEGWLSEDSFQRGLHRYLTTYAHGNATAHDFIAALSAEAQAESRPYEASALPKAMASFLDQPGVPMVSLSLSCKAGAASLSYHQQRYLPVGVQLPAGEAPLYHLPLCFATDSGARRCQLLEQPSGEIPLGPKCPTFVHADPSVSGYAFVKYEGELLEHILQRAFPEAGGKAQLDVTQQLGLLLDLSALSRSGDLPVDRLLPVVERAAAADDRYLVSAAVRIVHGLRQILPEGTQADPHFAGFVGRVFAPRLQALGLSTKPGDSDDVKLLRAALMPLVLGEAAVPALQAEAERLLTSWLQGDKGDAERAHALATAAAQRGNAKLWDALHKAALRTQDRNRRSLLLDALGSVRDPALAQASLDLLLHGEFEMREAMKLLWGIAAHPETRAVAYAFVKQHFDELVAKLPRDAGAGLARVASGFCDEERRADAAAFLAGRSTRYVGGPRVLNQTLEHITQCDHLRQAQGARLSNFLLAF